MTRDEKSYRDPSVERERRERERRDRARKRSHAPKPTPPPPPARAPRPVAARVRHEGLIGWITRIVRSFAHEVVDVLAAIARPVRAVVPTRSSSPTSPRSSRAPRSSRTPASRRVDAARRAALKRRIRIVAAVLSVATVAVAWFVVPASDAFKIRHVEVTGTAAVDDLQVRERADSMLAGKTVFTVDRDAIAKRIEELPFVQSVSVERHVPGGLELHVTEYEPLALAYGDGDFWLVSHDGRVLSKVDGDAWKGRIPTIVLRGDRVKPGMRLDDEPALQLLEAVPTGSTITFDTIRMEDEQLVAELPDGVDVRFGRPVDLVLKAAVVERMLQLAQRHGSKLLYIDVSVPGKPAMCLDESVQCHLPRGPKQDDDAKTVKTTQADEAPDT